MIAGIFHEGSGLGDQLFRYITVRTLAEEKGYEWGMVNDDNFKGKEFLDNMGLHSDFPLRMEGNVVDWNEKVVRDENDIDVRSYDPEINFVEDNTIIDGSFEDDKYWRHNLHNIDKWLKVDELFIPDYVCVIGFRGGEYAANPDLFLTQEYYTKAMWEMMQKGVKYFQVHTDDPELAKKYFPDCEIIDNKPISHSKHAAMGFNWRSARYAKYAIIPNSAFFILPRILKHHNGGDRTDLVKGGTVTIAPRYWARRNTKGPWRPAAYYPEFTYM